MSKPKKNEPENKLKKPIFKSIFETVLSQS